MPMQFTPEALARVLRNVDREVLREAIEIADIWDMFRSNERDAMQELAETFNFLSNLRVFGFAIIREDMETVIRELLSIEASISQNPLTSILGTLYVWLLQMILQISGIESTVQELREQFGTPVPQDTAELNRVIALANQAQLNLIGIASDLNTISATNVANMCLIGDRSFWNRHQDRIARVNDGVDTAITTLGEV